MLVRNGLLCLSACLCVFLLGCGTKHVKDATTDAYDIMQGDESVVFGRVLIRAHTGGEDTKIFNPKQVGLVHRDTGDRLLYVLGYEKVKKTEWPLGREVVNYETSLYPWLQIDGSFRWIVQKGRYEIDALKYWDPEKEFDPQLYGGRGIGFGSKPREAPECGFVFYPNMSFSVAAGDRAYYLGTLIVDVEIDREIKNAIVVKSIRGMEVRDEFEEASGELKDSIPDFTLHVEKGLMSRIPKTTASVKNGRCPSGAELFLRFLLTIPGHMGSQPWW